MSSSASPPPEDRRPSDPVPFVTVLMPVRNERDFIERAVLGVLDADYPGDRLEVLVIDGESDDGTREKLEELSRRHDRLRWTNNPDRIVPHAMNRGIAEAHGDVILRLDGHADVPRDFIRRSVEELMASPDRWCAGGVIETVGTNATGRAIAAAVATPIGVGHSRYRLGHEGAESFAGPIDTLAFGAYWKWVFDRIGLFDEELVRNQDDELNARIVAAGGVIWMTSTIRSRVFQRGSLRKLWRQYFQYGFWRPRTIQKLGRPATLRQTVPGLFVATWLVLALAALVSAPSRWLLLAALVAYTTLLGLGAFLVCKRHGWREALLAPLVFLTLHFAYGTGFWWGVLWFVALRRAAPRHGLSR